MFARGSLLIFLLFSASQGMAAVQEPKSFLKEKLIQFRNWGLESKVLKSGIDIRDAWKITKGDHKIIVAVIDTGVDATHPDLKTNIWHKPGSDEYGYDFVNNKKNPVDNFGHGTHIAGIIGATAKANESVIGVAPQVSIMSLKYVNDDRGQSDTVQNTVRAIDYAIANGARIINYSNGGQGQIPAEREAIKRAEAHGILFVAAAGNDDQDTDKSGSGYYPADYGLSNIISVAATNMRNQITSFSNWGKISVHVAAPGEQIWSTKPGGKYGYLSGTSQATAFVSGLAALLLSKRPNLRPDELKKIIMESSDKIEGHDRQIASQGRINAYKALKLALAKGL